MGQLIGWANSRYKMGWDDSIVKTRNPQQIKEDLTAASRKFFEEKRLDKAIEEALAADTGNEALGKHFKDTFNVTLPLWMVRQKDEDRKEAIRARVESILRAELLQFERFVLLEVLDPAWKDHLYEMDKLRDTINYRAFSQQDPRIEFKREGSRIYKEMQARTRTRVAEYVFRLKLSPQIGPPPQAQPGGGPAPQRPQVPAARPIAAPARVGPSMFAGPGFDAPAPRPNP